MKDWRRCDQTILFYNTNAKNYVAETVDLDISNIRNLFLNLIRDEGHILDLGCGSGRDSRFFIDQGYQVTAVDASPKIATLASELIGKPVEIQSFHELDYSDIFDGIWACASLLHCPKTEIDDLLHRITKGLKSNGIVYMSFKYGTGERIDGRGRLFNDYTEVDMSKMLATHTNLDIVQMFTELKPLRGGFQNWLNVFVRKSR